MKSFRNVFSAARLIFHPFNIKLRESKKNKKQKEDETAHCHTFGYENFDSYKSAIFKYSLNYVFQVLTYPIVFQTRETLTTKRFTDLGKLKFVMVGFRLEPISTTALAASKNDARFKSDQNRLEKSHLISLR